MKSYTVYPIRTMLIAPNDDIIQVIIDALKSAGITPQDGDVLVLAQSALSTAQGRLVDLRQIQPSPRAGDLASTFEMDPRFVQVIMDHSDRVLGGMKKVLLCEINNILIANAGIDQSNAPSDHVILLPDLSILNTIHEKLEAHYNAWLGLIISDSKTQPLRRGVVGIALGTAGFEPVEDNRGKPDLFGRILEFTFRAIADDLTTAAQLVMGEANERIPLVLIRGAPITRAKTPTFDPRMPFQDCLYMNVFKHEEDD